MRFFHILKSLPWKRIFLISLCFVLSLILIVSIFVTAYAERLLGQIQRPSLDNGSYGTTEYSKPTLPPDFTGETISPDQITPPPQPAQIIEHPDLINIMLVGQDRRPGQTHRSLSDTMILCSFNTKNKTITMTSFMRDLYVTIPGYSPNKMNHAYAWGGMKTLRSTMLENFGIKVDAFVEVDFAGFTTVVDALGGIDIYLTAEEAHYMNTTPLDGVNWEKWDVVEGINHLNGNQALYYSRIRHVGNHDFGRTERQRKVLSTILAECKNLSFYELDSLLTKLLPHVATDMSNATIVGYTNKLFPLLSGSRLITQRIPITGSYVGAWIGAIDGLVPDIEINRQFLLDTLMPR